MNPPRKIVQHASVAMFSFLTCAFLTIFNTGCHRIEYTDNPDYSLSFSADTVLFDTVFTTVGSVTLPLKVYNKNPEAIRIQEISVEQGEDSPFRINVDGFIGPSVLDLPLLAGDSLWIFIEVTIDPTQASLPFVIEDYIRFLTNGNEQRVNLTAWGQNAHFHGGLNGLNSIENCNEVWNSDLPHVVYGILRVDAGCNLTIMPGAEVYVHKGGGLFVYQSTLHVAGELGSEVMFQGDRLDDGYEDEAAQWGIEIDIELETEYGIDTYTALRGGIWIYGGVNCEINHAILKNGTIGIQVDTTSTSSGPALVLRNTRIHNMSAMGLLAQGATIDGYNNLFYDCGQSTAIFSLGGTYRMDHCSFLNYWSGGVRQAPSVIFTDWYEDINGQIQERTLAGSEFNNCIFWGNNHNLQDFDELVVSLLNPPTSPLIRHSAVDVQDEDFPEQILDACTTNEVPPFLSISDRDFHLNSNNSMWDGGVGQFNIGVDLDGLPRVVGWPDKGCYERQ